LQTWIIFTAVQMTFFWVLTTCKFVSWHRLFRVIFSVRPYCLRNYLHIFHSTINMDSVSSSETSAS
jgi:hypothetical protein